MWFLYFLSWVATVVQLCFVVLAVAAGLYYLADIVEEYTVMTGKIIRFLILVTLCIYVCLFLFEDLPLSLILCGAANQIGHLFILRTFPFFILTSAPFIVTVALLVINHYLAFNYFGSVYYHFSEVLAYFTLCLWIVPFAFFISLSANENILPTVSESKPLLTEDSDVVTNYFSHRSKRYGLLSFFNYAKESILPQRMKKTF
ncbi:protein TEX261-like isoform X1 [Limulus polyphemus]|uniref:Protein TEX261 n=1 Tax=Limulus polyphemus TaxID=6850 RepID=A0ABM1BE02_LIMPO|nr:protein TEX261-like isoform X1 [Limulus polyphemus]